MPTQHPKILQTEFSAALERWKRERCPHRTLWVGLVGPPGSGKSTLAAEASSQKNLGACVVPMDGYHLPKNRLNQMPDAAEAHRRRGAPFTFDARAFVEDLKIARQSGIGQFPSFDHHLGDPVPNAISFSSDQHQIVLVEGLYLLLPDLPWAELRREVFDVTCFLDVSIDICCDRVFLRHCRTGDSAQRARDRVNANDRLNAELVISQSRPRADYRIVSTDQPGC